jgi:uncharacterized membrane protein HdeD (DUF308 family)
VSPGDSFLLGAIATMSLLAALFFLRFWRQTGDRLFLLFAAAFGLEGLNRVALASTEHPNEGQPIFYAVRLTSYLVILLAIVQKNLARGR